MFEFHVVITKSTTYAGGDDSDATTLWQAYDGARATFEDAKSVTDDYLSRELVDGWTLDCLTIWPGDVTIPFDTDGQPLAWQDTDGSWVDAWNGIYVTYDELVKEIPHWTAREADRVLAFGESPVGDD